MTLDVCVWGGGGQGVIKGSLFPLLHISKGHQQLKLITSTEV